MRRRASAPALIAALIALIVAAPAAAQQLRDQGGRSHGRTGSAMSLLEARDIAVRGGLACDVTAARLLGRDDQGARHYELACREGAGYLVIDADEITAHDCLAMTGMNARIRRDGAAGRIGPECRLPANRNPLDRLTAMATEAGLDCRVDEGAMLGRTPDGRPLYEIGCRDAAGAWLEPAPDGWIVTDCLTVRAHGGRCLFTTRDEELAGVSAWLTDSPARDCAPTAVRAMGTNDQGLIYYEITCGSGQGPGETLVVSLDAERNVTGLLNCDEARRIGDGCAGAAQRPDPPD